MQEVRRIRAVVHQLDLEIAFLIAAGYQDNQINENLVTAYENDLICEANGLDYYGMMGGNRLDLMVQLQHYGGATRLLDVTRDPFVALWFAAHARADRSGIIYRYSIDKRYHAMPEQVSSWDDITSFKLAGKPILFTPKKINERVKAQSAAFLTTVLDGYLTQGSVFRNTTDLIDVKPILIHSTLKDKLIVYLKESRGLREYELFPDFQGFAIANSANSAFPRAADGLYDPEDDGGVFPSAFAPNHSIV